MSPPASANNTDDANEHIAVTRFREYLRIKTVQPNPDYVGSTAFLIRQAEEIGMPYKVVEVYMLTMHVVSRFQLLALPHNTLLTAVMSPVRRRQAYSVHDL
jgi:hypothetical protein